MSEPNESYAYFTDTREDLDPAHITENVGVTPTASWKKGELNPRGGRERKFGRRSLCSRLLRSGGFEADIADVLAQLKQIPEGFKQVSEAYDGCMQLVGSCQSLALCGVGLHVIKKKAHGRLSVWLHSL